MDEELVEQLVDRLTENLEARGVPSGVSLVEIAQIRSSLGAADDILRRWEAEIIRRETERNGLLS